MPSLQLGIEFTGDDSLWVLGSACVDGRNLKALFKKSVDGFWGVSFFKGFSTDKHRHISSSNPLIFLRF